MEKLIQTLLGELQKISRAETVVGEAIHSGEATIIPISRVQIGFGAGGSGKGTDSVQNDGKSRATGVGGGIRVEPVACVVVDKTGRSQLLHLSGTTSTTVGKIIDLVPQVMDRLGLSGEENVSKTESAKPKEGKQPSGK